MMSLSIGKGVCRLKDRNWLNHVTVWHGGFLSEALWRNVFVVDDEVRISILKGHKKDTVIQDETKINHDASPSSDAKAYTGS